jgi:glucans biosynthesis protein C
VNYSSAELRISHHDVLMGRISDQYQVSAWQVLWDCRGLLAFLGIVIHSAQIYAPEQITLSNGSSSIVFRYIADVIHAFRMQAFFVLSGCAAHIVFHRNRQRFFINRTMRLLVPFLVTALLLNIPLAQFVEAILGKPLEGTEHASILNLTYWKSGSWLAHLWFIRDLMVFTALYAILVNLQSIYFVSEAIKNRYSLLSSSGKVICSIAVAIAVALLPAGICSVFPVLNGDVFGSGTNILGVYREYLFYGVYFWLGLLIAAVPSCVASLVTVNRSLLLLCLTVCIVRGMFAVVDVEVETLRHLRHSSLFVKVCLEIFQQTTVIALMYLTLQIVGMLRSTRLSKTLTEWSQASYTVYLVHSPVVWVFAIALKPMDDPIGWKFAFMVLATSIVCLTFHRLFVAGSVQLTRFLFSGQTARA